MKKLKKWTSCFLIVLMLTGLFTVSGFALEGSAAGAYAKVLKGQIEQYGITSGSDQMGPAGKGIQYAGLTDLDGDKIEELVIVRYVTDDTANIGIWTCKNGQAVRVADHEALASGFVISYINPVTIDGKKGIYFYNSGMKAGVLSETIEFIGADGAVKDLKEGLTGLDTRDSLAYGEGSVWFYNEKQAKAVSALQTQLEKQAGQQGTGGAASGQQGAETTPAGQKGTEAGSSDQQWTGSVPSDWAKSLVAEAVAAKIVPDSVKRDYHAFITRAQFAEMAVQAIEAGGKTLPEGEAFADCSLDYVRKARAAGIVSGSGNNRFEPDSFILREEMAAMIVNTSEYMMKLGGYSYVGGINDADAEAAIMASPEFQEVSEWARKFMRRAQDEGLIQGTGSGFAPQKNTTCQEAVIIMWKAAHPYVDAMKGTFDSEKYIYIKNIE